MYSLREKVVWFAVFSRACVIVLQTLSNLIIPDHNAEDVFRRPMPETSKPTFLDSAVDILFGGLERWDAQYFLHIAEHGYIYENTLAFFPLFPITIRFLSVCFSTVTCGSLSMRSCLLLASVSLNTACFIKAADALFCLSLRVLNDEVVAYKAALLFCINPASIFFSAPYSEALFVLLSFQGMRQSLDRQYSKLCAIPFGLAAAARSNGILNVGFILYANIQEFLSEEWPRLMRGGLKCSLILPFKVLPSLYQLVESCIIALAPFIAYQVYCYVLFCTPQKLHIQEYVFEHGKKNSFIFPEYGENFQRDESHWCHFQFPIAYSYVQDHYWNVGLFQYYEWKQMPNFLLAFPIICLVAYGSYKFFQQHKSMFLHLGLKPVDVREEVKCRGRMSPYMFVFVVHVVFLSLFCTAFVHIQVTTRMICSSSPVPYWYAAYILNYKPRKGINVTARNGKKLLTSQMKKISSSKEIVPSPELIENMTSGWSVLILSKMPDTKGKIIIVYFISYTIIGTVMFSNFLPWT